MSAFDPAVPWNSVTRASATNAEFWDRALKEPALEWTLGLNAGGRPVVPAFRTPPGQIDPPLRTKIKKKSREQRRQDQIEREKGGQATVKTPKASENRDDHGTQFCFAFGRHAGGCSEPCPNKRSHACELCKGAHRSIECPTNPGWKPPSQKGKGKGAKGGGKSARRYD